MDFGFDCVERLKNYVVAYDVLVLLFEPQIFFLPTTQAAWCVVNSNNPQCDMSAIIYSGAEYLFPYA
jgi:hypothetical protein